MEPTQILIVDDREANISALSELIQADDVRTVSATNGHEALSLVLDNDIALALIDVQMPEMSGFELAKLMRGAERTRHIPIIFVTAARHEEAQVFEGYEQGAVDFLIKPLDPHIVRSKIRVFIELDQNQKMLQRQMQELRLLNAAAEEASRVKTRFLANMSHEIRTPLSAVLGFAELLHADKVCEEERSTVIESIIRNGRLLVELIDDILDISKIEAGRLTIEQIRVNLDELFEDVISTFSVQASKKDLYLLVEKDEELPKDILSDPFRLRQILNNLVGNAIKFTASGGITLKVRQFRCEESGKGMLVIDVEDTGCGIEESVREKVFKPFHQEDSSTTRRYGGTGLGLAISKRLADALNGELKLLRSARGSGSVFRLMIEAKPFERIRNEAGSEVSSKSAISKLPLVGRRILVIDDVTDNQMLLNRMLTVYGAKVITAGSAEEGILLATQCDVDVVLMDIQMPEMDGYEATAELRRRGFRKPIIALTAHAMDGDKKRCFLVGCNDHIAKPFARDELVGKINFHSSPFASDWQTVFSDEGEDLLEMEEIAPIIDQYMASTLPEQLKRLSQAVVASDFGTVAKIGHDIKGSVGVYQYPQLKQFASMLEAEAKGGADRKFLSECIIKLWQLL